MDRLRFTLPLRLYMKTKSFDCIKMKRKGSLKIHALLKGKSVEEQIAYWRERNERFRKETTLLNSTNQLAKKSE